jgi:hypothetical protein
VGRDPGRQRRRRWGPVGLILPILASFGFWIPSAAAAQSSDPEPAEDSLDGIEAFPVSSWLAEPNIGYGSFHPAALGFFASLRPGFIPRLPTNLPAGMFEVRATESWAKVISEKDGAYDLDYEVLRTEAALSYGLPLGMLLELDFDTASRVGGILDPFMNGFHNTFGIPLGPRGRLPNDAFRIHLEPGQGRPNINLDGDAGDPFARTLTLTFQQIVFHGGERWPTLSYSISVGPSLEPYGGLSGGSPVALAASISLSKGYGDFHVALGFDYAWFGLEDYLGSTLRATRWGILAVAEWNCFDNFSLAIEFLSMRGQIDSFSGFSRPSFELNYGFHWEILRSFRIDFSMIHDLENPANAPDFGFQLGLLLRFD